MQDFKHSNSFSLKNAIKDIHDYVRAQPEQALDLFVKSAGESKRVQDLETGSTNDYFREIIQNIHDSATLKDVPTPLVIDSSEDEISVCYLGRPFSKEDFMNILCGTNREKQQSHKYLGEKGKGFKSLFNIASEVRYQVNDEVFVYSKSRYEESDLYKSFLREKGGGQNLYELFYMCIPFYEGKADSSMGEGCNMKISLAIFNKNRMREKSVRELLRQSHLPFIDPDRIVINGERFTDSCSFAGAKSKYIKDFLNEQDFVHLGEARKGETETKYLDLGDTPIFTSYEVLNGEPPILNTFPIQCAQLPDLGFKVNAKFVLTTQRRELRGSNEHGEEWYLKVNQTILKAAARFITEDLYENRNHYPEEVAFEIFSKAMEESAKRNLFLRDYLKVIENCDLKIFKTMADTFARLSELKSCRELSLLEFLTNKKVIKLRPDFKVFSPKVKMMRMYGGLCKSMPITEAAERIHKQLKSKDDRSELLAELLSMENKEPELLTFLSPLLFNEEVAPNEGRKFSKGKSPCFEGCEIKVDELVSNDLVNPLIKLYNLKRPVVNLCSKISYKGGEYDLNQVRLVEVENIPVGTIGNLLLVRKDTQIRLGNYSGEFENTVKYMSKKAETSLSLTLKDIVYAWNLEPGKVIDIFLEKVRCGELRRLELAVLVGKDGLTYRLKDVRTNLVKNLGEKQKEVLLEDLLVENLLFEQSFEEPYLSVVKELPSVRIGDLVTEKIKEILLTNETAFFKVDLTLKCLSNFELASKEKEDIFHLAGKIIINTAQSLKLEDSLAFVDDTPFSLGPLKQLFLANKDIFEYLGVKKDIKGILRPNGYPCEKYLEIVNSNEQLNRMYWFFFVDSTLFRKDFNPSSWSPEEKRSLKLICVDHSVIPFSDLEKVRCFENIESFQSVQDRVPEILDSLEFWRAFGIHEKFLVSEKEILTAFEKMTEAREDKFLDEDYRALQGFFSFDSKRLKRTLEWIESEINAKGHKFVREKIVWRAQSGELKSLTELVWKGESTKTRPGVFYWTDFEDCEDHFIDFSNESRVFLEEILGGLGLNPLSGEFAYDQQITCGGSEEAFKGKVKVAGDDITFRVLSKPLSLKYGSKEFRCVTGMLYDNCFSFTLKHFNGDERNLESLRGQLPYVFRNLQNAIRDIKKKEVKDSEKAHFIDTVISKIMGTVKENTFFISGTPRKSPEVAQDYNNQLTVRSLNEDSTHTSGIRPHTLVAGKQNRADLTLIHESYEQVIDDEEKPARPKGDIISAGNGIKLISHKKHSHKSEKSFFERLKEDIRKATEEVIIASGWVRESGLRGWEELFSEMKGKGVKVKLFFEKNDFHGQFTSDIGALETLGKFEGERFQIYTQAQMHVKAVIVDGDIAYFGTHNFLSNSGDHYMDLTLRYEGEEHRELIAKIKEQIERCENFAQHEGVLGGLPRKVKAS